MMFRVVAVSLALSLGFSGAAARAQVVEGACGGIMRGYDGRNYPCGADRKPACDQSTGRCVCLAKRECGARHDEPF